MPRSSLDPAADLAVTRMPPTELLPRPLAEAVASYDQARISFDVAKQEATHFEQTDLAHARERDIIALADAQEAGKKAPAPKAEAEALERLAALKRDVAAKELVEDRARDRLQDALASEHAEIVEQADERVEKARSEVSAVVGELEAKLEKLSVAEALVAWSQAPTRPFKVRTLAAPIPVSADEPTVDLVLAGLRGVVEPPEAKPHVVADVADQPVYVCPHCSGPHPLIDCTGDPNLETKRPPLPKLPTAA